ncbi:hypothetical protein M0R45_035187 [Rubus argutus]|uniref:ABC transmembrane type-1 domain-containing protein n=1 Tax=Rubus argutus TaxID=59490 RepID=A0AAW1VTF6_RUBAR
MASPNHFSMEKVINIQKEDNILHTGKLLFFNSSRLSWLNPLFAVGFKKPIDQEEIPDVDIKDSAEYLSHSFDESLQHVKERDGTTNPEIYKTMYLFIRKKAAINAMFAVICAIASYVGPYLINDFVNFLTEKKNSKLRERLLSCTCFSRSQDG